MTQTPEEIQIIRDGVGLATLTTLAERGFGDLVKAVVDVEQRVMAIGGSLHADEEAALVDLGSSQTDLWGINRYPAQYGDADWIEFDSMINVRPAQDNRSRAVESADLQHRIVEIVGQLVRADG
jgi:hypothetical protein